MSATLRLYDGKLGGASPPYMAAADAGPDVIPWGRIARDASATDEWIECRSEPFSASYEVEVGSVLLCVRTGETMVVVALDMDTQRPRERVLRGVEIPGRHHRGASPLFKKDWLLLLGRVPATDLPASKDHADDHTLAPPQSAP